MVRLHKLNSFLKPIKLIFDICHGSHQHRRMQWGLMIFARMWTFRSCRVLRQLRYKQGFSKILERKKSQGAKLEELYDGPATPNHCYLASTDSNTCDFFGGRFEIPRLYQLSKGPMRPEGQHQRRYG